MKAIIHGIENLPEIKPFVGSHREVRREMFIHERSQFKLPSLLDFDDATQEEILNSDSFFRFTIVRNPYTRLQSAWQDKVRLCAPRYEELYYVLKGALPSGTNPESIVSFPKFVGTIAPEDLPTCDHHWRLQTAHLFHPAIDFTQIGHLEQFNTVLAALSAHAGLTIDSPPVLNEAGSPSQDDDDLARVVHALYQADFDAFGYAEKSWPRPHDRTD